jgi:hypothetical protein
MRCRLEKFADVLGLARPVPGFQIVVPRDYGYCSWLARWRRCVFCQAVPRQNSIPAENGLIFCLKESRNKCFLVRISGAEAARSRKSHAEGINIAGSSNGCGL